MYEEAHAFDTEAHGFQNARTSKAYDPEVRSACHATNKLVVYIRRIKDRVTLKLEWQRQTLRQRATALSRKILVSQQQKHASNRMDIGPTQLFIK